MIVIWPDDNLIDRFLSKEPGRKLIFEAGQGMLLDQNRKEYHPYLTRSSTGIKNVLELLKTVQTSIDMEVLLVTRPYLTRHGDGPIFNHIPGTFPFVGIEELTNVDNLFQGKMRYGYLNKEWYEKAIFETIERLKKDHPACLQNDSVGVAMTCCDHVRNGFEYCLTDDWQNMIQGEFMDFPNIKLMSYGKTEKDINELL